MKKILSFFFGIFFCLSISSQNGIDNDKAHRRYWYYRTRLINDFMKVGKNQGDCFMITERNNGGRNQKEIKVGPDQMDIFNHYIMVLALEYKMLTRGNQNTDETVKEIWHMLYAINRLDKEANQFWESSPPTSAYISSNSSLDGFLIREDVPPDYYDQSHNEKDFNFSEKEYIPATPPTGFCGTEYINNMAGYFSNSSPGSKFQAYLNDPSSSNKDGMGIPTDKFHSMFTALLFVIKYLPNQVYYYENGTPQIFQDSEISLKQEAKNIAYKDTINNLFKVFEIPYVNSVYPNFAFNYPLDQNPKSWINIGLAVQDTSKINGQSVFNGSQVIDIIRGNIQTDGSYKYKINSKGLKYSLYERIDVVNNQITYTKYESTLLNTNF